MSPRCFAFGLPTTALLTLLATLTILVSIAWAGQCTNEIFCIGSVLSTVQSHQLFPDDKTFVDRVIIPDISEEEFRRKWNELSPDQRADNELVKQFVLKFTLDPGSDILPVGPTDFDLNPPFIDHVVQTLRPFALEVHHKWKSLVREVKALPYGQSSIIPVPHPFVIAGGRFREWYNWDSYWILLGLYTSNMPKTSIDLIRNHLWCIETYGYVPNGGRIYYLNRSQPPLLSLSIWGYFQRFGGDLLEEAFPTLLKEYDYWMSAQHLVSVTDSQGTVHLLNRYNVDNDQPRPESWFKDWELSEKAQNKAKFYKDVASAAESGWDFSSRWFKDFENLHTIRTSDIIPVDLNSILYNVEKHLALIAQQIGDIPAFERLITAKQNRGLAIYRIFWSQELNTWFDFDMDSGKQITNTGKNSEPVHFLSQYLPIWAGASHLSNTINNQLLRTMVQKQIKTGGLPTSNQDVRQQWDWDNVWAPLQFFIIEALDITANDNVGGGPNKLPNNGPHHDDKNDEAKIAPYLNSNPSSPLDPLLNAELYQLVTTWVSATQCSWKSDKQRQPIFEKYDAAHLGKPGGGGEYTVQEGFGWSNGVLLYYLERYGMKITLNQDCA